MTHSARRINNLANHLGLKTYLEIGVCEGDTFKLVSIPERTGVDPNFRFDAESLKNPMTNLISATSDDFFASLPIEKKFDVVFIDGLHTFEQVVRDFSNAVIHTHDKSVIVLDDTRPSDALSALPDQLSTNKYRQLFKSDSKDWHGDVFKTVFYIADFWPSMSYCTVATGGNPQTVVWRAASGMRVKTFDSLEKISRLTFFDMHDHIDVLQLVPEEQALSRCISELTGRPS